MTPMSHEPLLRDFGPLVTSGLLAEAAALQREPLNWLGWSHQTYIKANSLKASLFSQRQRAMGSCAKVGGYFLIIK